MLPPSFISKDGNPSMIRNINSSASSCTSASSNSNSSNIPLHCVGAGGQQTSNNNNNNNNNSNSNNNNNNNQNHLMQQLRMITAQLQRNNPAIASTITSSMGFSPAAPIMASTVTQATQQTTQQQQQQQQQQLQQQQHQLQQTNLRPEVPRSNACVIPTAVSSSSSNSNIINNNNNIGKNTNNAIVIDVDNNSNNSNNNNNSSNASTNNGNSPASNSNSNSNDSQAELFPYILHGMLEDAERMGQTNIVSWNPDGKSFRIHDPDEFVLQVLKKYFGKYIGGVASKLTQFRSDLKDWGFEDSVDTCSNRMMSEIFTHHCFQKGQSILCRYMRCGRKKEEVLVNVNVKTATIMNTAATNNMPQAQAQAQAPNIPVLVQAAPVATNMDLGNAAQMLLRQQIQQAQANQQHQQQQAQQAQQQQQQAQAQAQAQQAQAQQALQQQQALQLQALLSGVTNGSNPVAQMLLNQILLGQQQQQFAPQVMAAAAAVQRQQQQQLKTDVAVNPMNTVSPHNPLATPSMPMAGGIVRTVSVSTNNNTPMNNQPVRQWTNTAPAPQVKRVVSVTNAAATIRSKPTVSVLPKKTTTTATTTARPAVSAKRAAFLNKRTKATGAAYRNPNKKQKRAPSTTSAVIKNRKKTVATKAFTSLANKNGGNVNAFALNEDFKEKAVVDLLFPWKLHDMLDDAERSEDLKTNVVSWQADGVSFNIHDKDRFVNEVIPRYFGKTPKEWESFINILSSWGFVRFTSGTQKGAFIHRLLVKGKRSICKQMRINGKTVSDWMKQHGQFLGRLHALLCHAEKEGKRDIVSWTPDGKKFKIHDPSGFMNSVFPMYFDSLTYSSFEQKLRRWGFMRSPANHQKIDKETKMENAVYSHPHFVRGKVPNLVWVKSDTKIPRTLQQHNFLVRLRVMLSDASRHGHQFVVSWAPHGKAFMIHDRPYFSNTIMPNYFKSKFTSFRQSLRNHGFAQIGGNGWDEGAYYHKLFLREEPLLCQGLTQDQMKKAMPEWIPVEDEPNFYPTDTTTTTTTNHESAVAAAAMVSLKSSPQRADGKWSCL